MLESFHVHPIICLTKMDLLEKDEREELQNYIADYESMGYTVLQTYKDEEELVERLRPILKGKPLF